MSPIGAILLIVLCAMSACLAPFFRASSLNEYFYLPIFLLTAGGCVAVLLSEIISRVH